MFKELRARWIAARENRQAQRYEADWRRGYDCVVELLKSGTETPADIEARTAYSNHAFDRGADAAVDDLVAQGVVKDNRVL